MGDNTKFILHVDDQGNVVKAEKEDPATGERTEVSGNLTDLKISSTTSKSDSSVMNWMVAQPDEEPDDGTSAPTV